jgi:hypothetical protein
MTVNYSGGARLVCVARDTIRACDFIVRIHHALHFKRSARSDHRTLSETRSQSLELEIA